MEIKFNINNFVKVKLTPYGKSIFKNRRPNMDHQGSTFTFQLWVLMNIFGDEMWNGNEQIFENSIITIVAEVYQ